MKQDLEKRPVQKNEKQLAKEIYLASQFLLHRVEAGIIDFIQQNCQIQKQTWLVISVSRTQ